MLKYSLNKFLLFIFSTLMQIYKQKILSSNKNIKKDLFLNVTV